MEIRTAKRSRSRLRLALQGCSGSGKTYSALQAAFGLVGDWTKIVVLDTEHSADLYSHVGAFKVLSLDPAFTPERYLQAFRECERNQAQVIIIDSLSHLWDGEGGILETHSKMAGNSFTAWSKLTPRYNLVIQAILTSPAHVICCLRTKQDYVLTEKNGKQVPEKVGLKAVAKDGLDYEMTLVFDLDIQHYAHASKDRTGLFTDKPPFRITSDLGTQLKTWCEFGTNNSEKEVHVMIESCNDLTQLYALYRLYPEYQKSLLPQFESRRADLTPAQPLSA